MFDRQVVMRLLTALGDPARLDIIFLLGGGRRNVGDIAGNFKLSRPAISHHLKVLKDAGVVRSEKVGQEVFYWVDEAQIVNALREMADAVESCVRADQLTA